VAFGFLGSYIEIWDLAKKQVLQKLRGSSGVINTLSFSPDGRRLLSGNHNGTFNLWGVHTGTPLQAWQAHTSGVRLLAFSPDGQRIFSTAEGSPYSVNVFE
jgi:WD40 repeat protein